MTDSIFTRLCTSVLNMSLTGSIVILAVLVIRFFLRKAPRKWSYLLWLVVAFRLICPVSIAAPVSLMGAVRAPATTRGTIEYIPQIMVTPQTPAVSPVNPTPGLSIPDSVTPEPQIPPASDPVSTMDILAVVTSRYKLDTERYPEAGLTYVKKLPVGGRLPYLFG